MAKIRAIALDFRILPGIPLEFLPIPSVDWAPVKYGSSHAVISDQKAPQPDSSGNRFSA
ncbi:hypothetical protein [Lonsdalea iberica]|uniref:hypothetical protein n=1 Tax=Lonsdalea iberica TaxID=1082703 RepID=UPI001428C9E5|nr:hypothetical protein [Lonsdalea iberica]